MIAPADTTHIERAKSFERGKYYIDKAGQATDLCNFEAALDLYEKAIPYYEPFDGGLEVVEAINSGCASVCLYAGKFKDSIAYSRKRETTVRSFYERAIAHFCLGEFTECIENCIPVVINSPEIPQVLWLRGLARMKTGDRTMAKEDFKKALSLDEKHGVEYHDHEFSAYHKGLGLAYLGKQKEALEFLKLCHEEATKTGIEFLIEKSLLAAKKINGQKISKK